MPSTRPELYVQGLNPLLGGRIYYYRHWTDEEIEFLHC